MVYGGGGRPRASGGRLRGGLALLQDPDRVAERVTESHVRAIEMVGGLLREVGHAAPLQLLVERVRVIGDEDQTAQRPLRDELAQLGRGRFVVEGRTRLLE